MTIRKAGRDQGAQDQGQDQGDDEQDEGHDQLRVAGVDLLDVVVLRRDAAEQAGGGDRVQAIADPLDRVGGFARVGVAVEDDHDHRLVAFAARRHRQRQLDRAEPLHPGDDGADLLGLDDRGQRRADPGREVFVQNRGAAAGVGRLGLALAEADRAVVAEVAEREHDQQRRDAEDDRPRAPAHEAGDPAPGAARFLWHDSRNQGTARAGGGGPEGALAEQREQRRQQGEGGGEHHRDADRQDRAEPVGRLQVGDQQHQHRRDHRPARGGDRRDALGESGGQGVAAGPRRSAAPPGSGGPAAASSRCRRRRSAPGGGRCPRC